MPQKINQFKYCNSFFEYNRRSSYSVSVGNLKIGGESPIRVQSMTTTNSLDTNGTSEQAIRIVKNGGELVRITTQGRREAKNLLNIKNNLKSQGYNFPLVADIHFNPNAAEIAAKLVEKVRINPGNFVDGAKMLSKVEFSESEWDEGVSKIRNKLVPFLNICKENNTAIRVGTNHGSLSDRIMSRYGDTPEGMVESCMEFLRICRESEFDQIVLSIKSSNTRIMVHTVRLLVAKMDEEDMNFPIHLGVTEAGDGEDGRIKSAVGIGALLCEGIGDTIRVSLTEEPENEIPVATALIEHVHQLTDSLPIVPFEIKQFNPFEYERRRTFEVLNIGENNAPVVIHSLNDLRFFETFNVTTPDFIYCEDISIINITPKNYHVIYPFSIEADIHERANCYPLFSINNYKKAKKDEIGFIQIRYNELTIDLIEWLRNAKSIVILALSDQVNSMFEQRALIWKLQNEDIDNPVIVQKAYTDKEQELFQLKAATDNGLLFLDGLSDGIFISNKNLSDTIVVSTQFNILQASRVRFSKTDYISCPGCGRTLFALQDVVSEIKQRTSHLKNLKIGIMGCVVNGIGEMADADYGYVGSGVDKISLYKNKNLIKKNISTHLALDELINLIKVHGDWIDP